MKKQMTIKGIITFLILIVLAGVSYRFISVDETKISKMETKIIQDKGMSIEDFKKKISQDKLVLVYFNASWCAPCIKLKPEMDDLQKETAAYCEVLQINTDDHPKVAEYYEINSLPMFTLYKGGKKLWENVGALTKTQLQTKISAFSK